MTFELSSSGGNILGSEWVAAEGEITHRTPDRLREFLRQHDFAPTFVFNSPGGDLLAGIQVGEIIRDRGAFTSVGDTVRQGGDFPLDGRKPGICASACAFAFMGGVDRSVGDEDRLGMHQFFAIEDEAFNSSDVQRLVGVTLIYSMRMGIDPVVIAAASHTLPEDMYFFSKTELQETNLITESRRQDDWRITPNLGGIFLETTYYGWAAQIVKVRVYCSASNQRMQIMYVEENEFEANRLKVPLIERYGDTGPQLVIEDENVIQLRPSNVGFQNVGEGRVAIALNFPSSDMLSLSGLKVRFDPRFPNVLGNLLHTEVTLPPREWLELVTGNCMKM